MKIKLLIILAAAGLAGCNNKTGQADAFGNFEATEVIVSAETNGRILQFYAKEGINIEKNAEIAQIGRASWRERV